MGMNRRAFLRTAGAGVAAAVVGAQSGGCVYSAEATGLDEEARRASRVVSMSQAQQLVLAHHVGGTKHGVLDAIPEKTTVVTYSPHNAKREVYIHIKVTFPGGKSHYLLHEDAACSDIPAPLWAFPDGVWRNATFVNMSQWPIVSWAVKRENRFKTA